jgi:hypothetical protein
MPGALVWHSQAGGGLFCVGHGNGVAFGHGDPHADLYCDGYALGHSDRDHGPGDGHVVAPANSNRDACAFCDTFGHADGHDDPHADLYCNGDALRDADCDHGPGDRHTVAFGHPHGHPHSDADGHTVRVLQRRRFDG